MKFIAVLVLLPISALAQSLVVESSQLHIHPASQTVVFSGAVSATHQLLQLNAEQVQLNLDEQQQLQQLLATEQVQLRHGGDTAFGQQLIYDPTTQRAELTGEVILNRSGTTLRGGKLVYDANTGALNLEQGGEGRIRAELNQDQDTRNEQ